MRKHEGGGRLFGSVIMVLLVMLLFSAAGSAPVMAADNTDASGASKSTADTPESQDEANASFDEFDAFEEFDTDAPEPVFDPLSGYNRFMTHVNDRLYYWVLKPTARVWQCFIPEPAREGIGNFFRNLGFPSRLVNNLLQLKFKRAGSETVRFVVNSTVGVAGLWDPSTAWLDMPVYSEDFGQTLGYYGLGGGFHVVLPLLGPSNVRDIFGKAGDWFLDPVNYLEDTQAQVAVDGGKTVNQTSLSLGQYEAITKDSVDLYILLRDGYRNRRNKAIEE